MNKAVWVKSSVEKSNDCGKTLKYPLMSLMSKKNSNCLLQLFRFAETHGELDDYSIVRRRNEGRPRPFHVLCPGGCTDYTWDLVVQQQHGKWSVVSLA